MSSRNFFVELKRRNVYRAAVAYGVVAWFLTQLTTQVFPFLIAMLLSWVYEFTPEGVVRTEDLDPAIDWQTSRNDVQSWQLRLQRNYGEAIRLLEAELAQFHYVTQEDKGSDQVGLALIQRFAGDTASPKVTAEQARNTFERLLREHPDSWVYAASQSNA